MKENLYSIEKKIKLQPNEQCICGSGLKYKECCLDKNFDYKTLGKNYEGRNITFNSTEINDLYEEISNFLLKDILDKELSVSKGKEYLKHLYRNAENGTSYFTKYASCKKGCSGCCHIYMDCTAIEAELIREYILKNFNEKQIMSLNDKIKETINQIPEYNEILEASNKIDLINKYGAKHLPCIFLSEDNSCSIYDVRPFNCRKLISFSKNSDCMEGDIIVKPNISIDNIVSYSINHLSMNITRYKKLKIYSKDEAEYKSIYKSIQHWFINGFNEINRNL
ncbi:SEC-C domain-containing protein [Clostridium sp. OS1-26]|uniref:SEC-C domain-containing protein n=1 Tax=Clostridium sp. OS1-26 TaxID=3070681 RepID=UPI0027E1C540|nr:SEC-C domain-containing protein [Clostridium sp. OS1-26]WML35029.1 SEC-C domain-containing protein [Clostridium sp. OS1-26]